MLWITGANGLVGSTLRAKCKAALHTGREVDISNRDQVFAFVDQHPEITHIVNCAAFSQVDAAEVRKEEAYRANVIGPENLARTGKKLIHLSTDYVFSGHLNRPLTELDPVGPCNYYGQTKLEGEQRALALSACVIRTSWVFGPGGKNFLSQFLHTLQTQKELRLTNDQWSRFTYAPDLASAILQMLESTGLYHYANTGVATKYLFGLAMREEASLLGFPLATTSIIPIPGASFPTPCKRPPYSAFDTTKIDLPIRPWREALREFLCAQLPAYS